MLGKYIFQTLQPKNSPIHNLSLSRCAEPYRADRDKIRLRKSVFEAGVSRKILPLCILSEFLFLFAFSLLFFFFLFNSSPFGEAGLRVPGKHGTRLYRRRTANDFLVLFFRARRKDVAGAYLSEVTLLDFGLVHKS